MQFCSHTKTEKKKNNKKKIKNNKKKNANAHGLRRTTAYLLYICKRKSNHATIDYTNEIQIQAERE